VVSSNIKQLLVFTLIEPKVREQIRARTEGLTLNKFHTLSARKILALLQAQIKPETTLAFTKMLSKNVVFPTLHQGYTPTSVTFQTLYDALLQYKATLTNVYEILAENNEDNTPPVSNKEGGLLKIFMKRFLLIMALIFINRWALPNLSQFISFSTYFMMQLMFIMSLSRFPVISSKALVVLPISPIKHIRAVIIILKRVRNSFVSSNSNRIRISANNAERRNVPHKFGNLVHDPDANPEDLLKIK
jgi:hypothetical protein